MSLHLCCLFSFSQQLRSYTYFVRFTSNYFIFLGAIFKKIRFLKLTLWIHRNIRFFCIDFATWDSITLTSSKSFSGGFPRVFLHTWSCSWQQREFCFLLFNLSACFFFFLPHYTGWDFQFLDEEKLRDWASLLCS